MRIVYLHGFASSPQSSKAKFFAQKFAEAGVPFVVPQLDGGDFSRLTITGQLGVVEQAVSQQLEPVVLMGSSLGGYLAALYAVRHAKQVQGLVLLAPAFRFLERWRARFTTEQLENWRRQGTLPFFHYGVQKELGLGYQLIEDAYRYEAEPDFRQPTLLMHGTSDDVVPVSGSHEFADNHRNVILKLFSSGHELTDVLDGLWNETERFLQSPLFTNPSHQNT